MDKLKSVLLRRLKIRPAGLAECDAIRSLINTSARTLAAGDYTIEQIEVALQGVWGLDTQLVRDGTYFVAEHDDIIAGCGGWSWRRTLFGGDALGSRDDRPLDAETEPAKIRAFFVHPNYARQGIGSRILEHCEREARSLGFRQLELGATLPGERLYRAHGYISGEPYAYECQPGKFMTIIPMSKQLA